MNTENLDGVMDFIRRHKMFEAGDRVGVAVSGGGDSMSLLHFLHGVAAAEIGFEIVAVNVNHKIRPTSHKDSKFVAEYCRTNNITHHGYSVDVPAFAAENKLCMEQAARIKRYECFDAAIAKYKLNKFAIAQHRSDQAETILMHIFRGSGTAGASGMETMNGIYVRPFLETAKADIRGYLYKNQIPYVEDETNKDNTYARNFIRNEIMPMLQREWRNVEKNIIDFGQNCRRDDEYIESVVSTWGVTGDANHVRVALNYFAYPAAVISRILLKAFDALGARYNIEKKHLDCILDLAKSGENGKRIDLPNNLYAIREYEFITIVKKSDAAKRVMSMPFKIGKTQFPKFGTIIVTKTITPKVARERGWLVLDVEKVPRTAKWRTRLDGDRFTKFGGGTKPLAEYLADRKIPMRGRDSLAVLAAGNEILAIAGVEISNRVRTDDTTVEAYVVEVVKD